MIELTIIHPSFDGGHDYTEDEHNLRLYTIDDIRACFQKIESSKEESYSLEIIRYKLIEYLSHIESSNKLRTNFF